MKLVCLEEENLRYNPPPPKKKLYREDIHSKLVFITIEHTLFSWKAFFKIDFTINLSNLTGVPHPLPICPKPVRKCSLMGLALWSQTGNFRARVVNHQARVQVIESLTAAFRHTLQQPQSGVLHETRGK